jgi:RNA polymerase sigma factor (sigma-70 family)
MHQPDRDLWERVRAHDVEAFRALFERYADDVYNFCYRRTGNWSSAEDLVSAVFLQAWRRHADLELTSRSQSLRPWLIGVAHNLLRNEARGRRRLAAGFLRGVDRETPDFADDALSRLGAQERLARLNDAVARLPRRERDAFLLYAWGELPYEEIAAVLRIPVGTVRSRISRARARLVELDSVPEHEQRDGTHAQEVL